MASTVEAEKKATTTKKAERLRIFKSDQFHRKGFKDVREQVAHKMGEHFESGLVKDIRANEYVVEKDGVRVHLAKVRILMILNIHIFRVIAAICSYILVCST